MHIENIYQKAGSKLIRFERLKNYTELPKRRVSMNAFCEAQFN